MVLAVAFAGLLALGCALLLQIVRQQGRILLRLEALDAQRHFLPDPALARNGHHHDQPEGLPVGAELGSFSLPTASGGSLGSDDLKGGRSLLVHWSPDCAFCEMIAADLAGAEGRLREAAVRLVLVSNGDAGGNLALAQQHGLKAPILLQDASNRAGAFEGLGTPVAYLLDEQGRVAAPLAEGAEEVPRLVAELASARDRSNRKLPGERDLATSRLLRDGLSAGTPAPDFTLPDVRGGTVSLQSYRGRPVLLVFTDPDCGPCDEALRRLAELPPAGDSLQVIVVGRGEAAENLDKVARHDVRFPCALQEHWRLSRRYGIFATPVAFLIDETGVIAREVAKGPDEIMALAEEGLALAGRS